jgi:hypothetical protein
MLELLAPSKVVDSNLPARASLARNMDWVRSSSDAFKGRWVALRDGQLVAHGTSVREVQQQVGSLRGLFVTRIS